MPDLVLNVNGRRTPVAVDELETLLTTLRDRLQLTGAKRGCNQGVCGACTVLVDGYPVRGCLSLSANCENSAIRTVEDGDATLAALQDAFITEGALQCGFCTSGMLNAARALLAVNRRPSVEEVKTALSGNLCRCTGYKTIVNAVRLAGERL